MRDDKAKEEVKEKGDGVEDVVEKFLEDLDNPFEDGLRSVRASDAGILDKDDALLPMAEAIVTVTKVLVMEGLSLRPPPRMRAKVRRGRTPCETN